MAVCSSVMSQRMLQLMTEILSGKLSRVIECSSCKLAKVKMIMFVLTVICTKIYQSLTALLKHNSDISCVF